MIRSEKSGRKSWLHTVKLQLKFYYGTVARRLYALHLLFTRTLEGETKHDLISAGQESQ